MFWCGQEVAWRQAQFFTAPSEGGGGRGDNEGGYDLRVNWGRVLTAMVTPFDAAGGLDREGAARLARHLVENGSDALVVAGTTGESPTLSEQEKLELLAAVREAVGGRVPVIMGTGSNNTAGSISLTRAAAQAGADGVMLVVPYYNKPSQEGLYRHFRAIAESTELPVMLYNVPSRTSRNLEPETCARLARDLPNVVAIKEASGDLDQVTKLLSLLPADVAVYSGDDSLTLPMVAVGCAGVVSVASHVAGGMLQEMLAAFFTGRTAEAASLHRKLFPLCKALFVTSNPVPVKAALSMLGLPAGGVRLPLVEATPAEREVIRQALDSVSS